MKNALLALGLMISGIGSYAQGTEMVPATDKIKKPSLGLHFVMNDFQTAAAIRSSSLSAVIREKRNAKFKQMSPGLALSYMQGINPQLDFSTSLAGSFLDYPFENGIVLRGTESLLLEADASIHAKLLPDQYWVNPYLTLGVGAFKYEGYYGAFMPAGAGLQINIFNEAYLLINTQYRIRVTENSTHHFYYSLGFAGSLGRD